MVDLNLNSLSIDKSGRVVFSGLGTGIDSQAAVDNIILAKRLPAVTLETRITDNDAKAAALQAFRNQLNGLKDAIANMRGAVSFADANNIFAQKQTFATTSRTDGQAPSAAGNLIGISVQNSAPIGSQTIEVRRIATAHKVASDSFASSSAALGLSGDFTIGNGTSSKVITVAATDSLLDIRDRINNANSGANATKVTASIVSVSSTEHVLILSNDTLGTELDITDASTVLSGLGLSADNGATFANEIQRAETARVTANGLTNPKHFETSRVASQTAQLSSFVSGVTFPGSFTINGAGSAAINYTATMSLADLADAINLETATTGVTASVVQDGNGYRLNLDSASAFTLTDSNALLAGLGTNNLQVIERNTNTISDLFAGMTVSLFGAEPGTTIKIDVDHDLTSVRGEIESFVEAYNEVRRLINEHSLRNADGTKAADAGVLFGTSIISDLRTALSSIIGSSTKGVSSDYAGLASIGISFIDNGNVEDALDKDTLKIDSAKLDEALISNPDEIRRLFSFELTSSNSNVVLLGYTGKTTYADTGYVLNVGTLGERNKDSAGVTSQTTLLNAAESFAAATSGSFTVNGALVSYDVTTDTLETLAAKINNASLSAGNGVTATIEAGPSNTVVLALSSSQSAITLDGDTGDLVAAMNVTANLDKIDSANIGGLADGSDDGSVTLSGRTITVTDASGAEGLRLFYNGTGSESAIDLNFTVGLAARLNAVIDRFVNSTDGTIQSELSAIQSQSEVAQARIDELDRRLALLRVSLTERFIAMETAVTTMNRLLESLRAQFNAMFGNSE
ncbi:MAG: flagellar filament capping protein FliD [Alphaproteobacteria bacterium]